MIYEQVGLANDNKRNFIKNHKKLLRDDMFSWVCVCFVIGHSKTPILHNFYASIPYGFEKYNLCRTRNGMNVNFSKYP